MVKNRLAELQAASKHIKASDVEAMNKGDGEEMKPLKDKNKLSSSTENFLVNMENVISNIDEVSEALEEVKKLQKKILGASHRNQNDETRLEDLKEKNKKMSVRIRASLKEEQANVDEKLNRLSSPAKLSQKEANELKMRKTQIAGQSTRFFKIWNEYNENQVEYRQMTKNLLVRRCKIVGNTDLTNEQIENMLDEGNVNVFAGAILNDERLAKKQLTELTERHDEFLKLEASIKEVHDMFLELATLVESQGEMVDNIAYNINNAAMDVEKGRDQLKSAEQSQKSARKKKICLFGILIVVLLIILLVLLIEFDAFSSSSSSSGENTRVIVQTIYVNVTPSSPSIPPPTTEFVEKVIIDPTNTTPKSTALP